MRFALQHQRAVDMVTHIKSCFVCFDGPSPLPNHRRLAFFTNQAACYVDSTAEITSDDKDNMTMCYYLDS
jgi:hypothetical protein